MIAMIDLLGETSLGICVSSRWHLPPGMTKADRRVAV
jgi:hypothetical protein